MKAIILFLLTLGLSISVMGQEPDKQDTTSIEISDLGEGLIKYKLKNVKHYRDTPFPGEVDEPFVIIDSAVNLKINEIIQASLSDERCLELKGKPIYLSFLINSRNGRIKSTEVSVSKRFNTKLTKKEALAIMHNLEKEMVFQVTDKYKDWGDVTYNLRGRI